jgi:hypothetical protein
MTAGTEAAVISVQEYLTHATWLSQFLMNNGQTIITGILITVGGVATVGILRKAWWLVALVVAALFQFLYWALIGWWASKIRRWITGSPW